METPHRGRHVCPDCGLHFALNASLKAHLKKHDHGFNLNENPNVSGDSCTSTTVGISTSNEDPQPMAQHFADHFVNSIPVDQPNCLTGEFTSLPTTSTGSFCQCSECNKIFDSQDKLHQHQKSKNHKGVVELNFKEKTKPTPDAESIIPSTSASAAITQRRVPSTNGFDCFLCARNFDSYDKLSQHTKSSGHLARMSESNLKEKVLKAEKHFEPNCLLVTTSVNQRSVKHQNSFDCASCARSFDSLEKLLQHNRSNGHLTKVKEITVPAQSSNRKGAVEVKEKVFPPKNLMSITEAPGSTDIYICNYSNCGKLFDSSFKLLQHQMMKGHNNNFIRSDEKTVLEPKTDNNLQHEMELPIEKKIFICQLPECQRDFPTMDRLLQHQQDRHPRKNGFHKLADLPDVHVSSASPSVTADSVGSEHACGECGKEFDDSLKLIQHISTKHTSPHGVPSVDNSTSTSPYRQLCEQCDEFNEASKHKGFIFLTYIAKHILKCHAPPNYVRGFCPICNQKLEKTKNLLAHIARAHLLIKFPNEACFICLRLCKDANELQQHTTAVHRFKCLMDECNSMFASKTLRDKHMLQKHGVHVCGREDCHAIFTSVEDKMRHMSNPHPVDTDSDSGMSSAYSHQKSLNRPKFETGFFSDPPRSISNSSYQSIDNRHYSADELQRPQEVTSEQSRTAAQRLLNYHLTHLQKVLKELREPLNIPANVNSADETVKLCDDVIVALNDIRGQYRQTLRVMSK